MLYDKIASLFEEITVPYPHPAIVLPFWKPIRGTPFTIEPCPRHWDAFLIIPDYLSRHEAQKFFPIIQLAGLPPRFIVL